MEAARAFVDVKNISLTYGKKRGFFTLSAGKQVQARSALRDISFQINQGAHVTLFGRSGGGKTSLLKIMSGLLAPTKGSVTINGVNPTSSATYAAGYISETAALRTTGTCFDALRQAVNVKDRNNLPARIGDVASRVGIEYLMGQLVATISSTERVRLQIARALLAGAPLLALDDSADHLGVPEVHKILQEAGEGLTAIIATRFAATAEELELPILLMHDSTLAQYGTCDELANAVACPRMLDVWVEGLRYDLFRTLKQHAGVSSVQILPTNQYAGQRLRIKVRSSRYLPSVYDTVNTASLLRVEEVPPSLLDIIARL